ncbi:hypothetical protein JCM5350_000175 [Sporobolomyces pararoseus]
MSFSSLPPELVHQIIESTVPHSFHSTTYKVRQDTLCRLSLVSRQFRSIAQPLLFEIAWIENDDQLKPIRRGDSEVAFRELVLEVGEELSSSFVGRTIGGSSNLRSLTIQSDNRDVFDLSVLSSCANLVNLQLSGACFDATSLVPLHSLQALSLDFRAAPTVPELVHPRIVPALKALGLENIYLDYELEDLENTRIEELLPQLNALCIELGLYRLAKDTLFLNFEPCILVTTDANQIQRAPRSESFSTIQQLRIDIRNHCNSRGRFDAIQVVLGFLQSGQQSKPRKLRSIYLDYEVQPVATDAEAVHGEFAQLEEECREAGIDLVFEVQGQNYSYESYMSPEFCRRQRERRKEA